MVTAMLFAGGIGARMKSSDLPKQFLEVGGKPIIVHTMEHFSSDAAHRIVSGDVPLRMTAPDPASRLPNQCIFAPV